MVNPRDKAGNADEEERTLSWAISMGLSCKHGYVHVCFRLVCAKDAVCLQCYLCMILYTKVCSFSSLFNKKKINEADFMMALKLVRRINSSVWYIYKNIKSFWIFCQVSVSAFVCNLRAGIAQSAVCWACVFDPPLSWGILTFMS